MYDDISVKAEPVTRGINAEKKEEEVYWAFLHFFVEYFKNSKEKLDRILEILKLRPSTQWKSKLKL